VGVLEPSELHTTYFGNMSLLTIVAAIGTLKRIAGSLMIFLYHNVSRATKGGY